MEDVAANLYTLIAYSASLERNIRLVILENAEREYEAVLLYSHQSGVDISMARLKSLKVKQNLTREII